MDNRVAIIGIIVEDLTSSAAINQILHENAQYIIGRMGIPYRARNISIISVAIDAPQDIINAISGKIGRLNSVTVKAAYSDVTCQC